MLEALPALFEVVDFSTPGKIAFGAHMRLQTLRTALASPKTAGDVKLDTLFTLTTEAAFRANEPLHYAMGREALRWLASKGLLWDYYHRWQREQLDDPAGDRSFQETVHKTPAEATAEWQQWLLRPEAEGFTPWRRW